MKVLNLLSLHPLLSAAIYKTYGPCCRVLFLFRPFTLVSGVENVRKVLTADHDTLRGDLPASTLKVWVGLDTDSYASILVCI